MQQCYIGKTRIQFIDIAKGIAIICIILGHLGNALINRVVFTFHVPIFFFITGFFISERRTTSSFIKQKAKTLLLPYYITCFVIIVIGTLIGVYYGNGKDSLFNWIYASLYAAGDNYSEPFYIKGIGAIWFLWATFWGSIFLRITLKYNIYLRLSCILLLFLVGYASARFIWLPLSIQAGACATLFMYIGFLTQKSKSTLKQLPFESKLFYFILAAFVWFSFIYNFQSFWLVHCDIGRGIIDIVGCICACSIVFLISYTIATKTSFWAHPLEYIGKCSLLVLCIHIIELNLFPWWKITEYLNQNQSSTISLLIIIVLKLILDLSLTIIMSRITIIRRLFCLSD